MWKSIEWRNINHMGSPETHLHSFNHNFWTGNSHLSEMGFPGGASGKEKKENEVAHPCPTLWDRIDSSMHQAPASMGFSRQEYWSGLPFPSPGNLPNPGMEPGSPRIVDRRFLIWATKEVLKNPSVNARDIRNAVSVPGSGRSPGGGHGSPLQDSCLENPMDRGAWRATVHGVAKSWTQLKWLNTHSSRWKPMKLTTYQLFLLLCTFPLMPVWKQLSWLLKCSFKSMTWASANALQFPIISSCTTYNLIFMMLTLITVRYWRTFQFLKSKA